MDINVHIPIILIIGIIISIIIIYSNFRSLKKEKQKLQEELKKLQSSINDLADQLFQKFKEKELENQKAFIAETAMTNAKLNLEMWKMEWETFYRQDAISRSQSVILGKVTEHLIPFHSTFPYNPKEARFIGSPIDLIVFDGVENEENVKVYLIEIKTGNSNLTKRQRLIRDAVLENRVYWRKLKID